MTISPKHVAIIMDGNGRWAEKRLLPRVAGHHRGVEALRTVVQHCIDIDLPILTLFAFSSENWQRPAAEVNLLMNIMQNLLNEEVEELNKNNVKLRVIGDLAGLSSALQQAIINAQTRTSLNTGLQLNIAVNYGGRWDIVQAARRIALAVSTKQLEIADLNEELLNHYICLGDVPFPDLLIRTSGEQRISNFLLWQLAYAELYFTPTLWPDFSTQDFDSALQFYSERQRRFGAIREQTEIASTA